jgi:hypothetical protein
MTLSGSGIDSLLQRSTIWIGTNKTTSLVFTKEFEELPDRISCRKSHQPLGKYFDGHPGLIWSCRKPSAGMKHQEASCLTSFEIVNQLMEKMQLLKLCFSKDP